MKFIKRISFDGKSIKSRTFVVCGICLLFTIIILIYVIKIVGKESDVVEGNFKKYEHMVEKECDITIVEWLENLEGKEIYVLNDTIWIGEDNTNIQVNENNKKIFETNDLKVVGYTIEEDERLIIDTSNDSVIDLGIVSELEISNDRMPVDMKYKEDESESNHLVENSEIEPQIVIEEIKIPKSQKNVELRVAVKNNPGILGMQMTLYYDENVMTLVDVINGDAFNNVLTMTKPIEYKSGCRFMWDGLEISDVNICDGDFMILKFNISDEVDIGGYPVKIEIEDGDIVNNDLEPIAVQIIDGKIEINRSLEGFE